MKKETKEIGALVALVLFLMGIVAVGLNGGFESRRSCGHLTDRFGGGPTLLEWITPSRHCRCNGFKLLTDFRMLHLAQRMHREDNQRNAADLNELLTYLGGSMRTNYYTLRYVADAEQWTVSVDRTSSLPGYYLFCMDGRVYFNEQHSASTNDLCLTTLKVE